MAGPRRPAKAGEPSKPPKPQAPPVPGPPPPYKPAYAALVREASEQGFTISEAVSYTHLDVYKRQALELRREPFLTRATLEAWGGRLYFVR